MKNAKFSKRFRLKKDAIEAEVIRLKMLQLGERVYSHLTITSNGKLSAYQIQQFVNSFDNLDSLDTDFSHDPEVFKKIWSLFNSDCHDSLVISIGFVISFIIFDCAVIINFDDDVKLQDFMLRLIQIIHKTSTSQFKAINVKAISSLILNLVDPKTRMALSPLFSIASWRKADVISYLDPDLVKNHNLREQYDLEIKKIDKLHGKSKVIQCVLSGWITDLINMFVEEKSNSKNLDFHEQVLNQLSIILSQLPTRRFIKSIIDIKTVLSIARCRKIAYTDSEEFCTVVKVFEYFYHFPIDEFSGELISEDEQRKQYTKRITKFQVVANSNFPEKFSEVLFGDISIFHDPSKIREQLESLDISVIEPLLEELKILFTKETRIQSILDYLSHDRTPLELLKQHDYLPLPTAPTLDNVLASPLFNNSQQYLCLEDLLMRNYFRIRSQKLNEVKSHLFKIFPKKSELYTKQNTAFDIPIRSPLLIEKDSSVSIKQNYLDFSEISVEIDLLDHNLKHTENLNNIKPADVVLFVKKGHSGVHTSVENTARYGFHMITPAMVTSVIDNDRKPKTNRRSNKLTIKAKLDVIVTDDELKNYNILVLLPKDNQAGGHSSSTVLDYKINLDSIIQQTDSLNQDEELEWLTNIVLGYGNKESGGWTNFNKGSPILLDQFSISPEVLKNALPGMTVNDKEPLSKKRKTDSNDCLVEGIVHSVLFEEDGYSLVIEPNGKKPQITLNPKQVAVLIQSNYEGLTLVQGSTGKKLLASLMAKSDVINHPKQKTLIITKHSTTLNEVFKNFETSGTFLNLNDDNQFEAKLDLSRQKLIGLFEQITEFAKVLEVDLMVTDEDSAAFFRTNFLESKWKAYLSSVSDVCDNSIILEAYPFKRMLDFDVYIEDFKQDDSRLFLKVIATHYFKICHIFWEVENISVIPKLNTYQEKLKFILLSQTKIIGVTQSDFQKHASDYGQYEHVIILEASQLDEFETLRPILSKKSVKRITLLGDAFLEHPANSSASLFEKLIRRSVPHIQLDA